MRSTNCAFFPGRLPTNAGDPISVGRSSVSKMSFTPTGMPCSAPRASRTSRVAAMARARPSSSATQALINASLARTRSRQASQYARALSAPSVSASTATLRSSAQDFSGALLEGTLRLLAVPLRPSLGVEQVGRPLPGERRGEVLRRERGHGRARGARGAADVRHQRDIVEVEKSGVEPRLALEHVEAGRCDALFLERRDQRRVVDDPAAGGVDQDRGRLHQRELLRADQVVARGGIRHVEAYEIRLPQELLQARVLRACGALDLARKPAAVVVQHPHREAFRALRDRLADAPHADDAEGRMVDVDAEKLVVLPALPVPRAQPALGLGDAPGRGHEQYPGGVRGGLVQHAGGIGRDDASLAARREVDVVVADRDVAHGLETRRRVEQGGVDAVAAGGEHAVLVGEAPAKLVGAPGRVVLLVVFDVESLAQLFDDVVEGGAGHENLGFQITSGHSYVRGQGKMEYTRISAQTKRAAAPPFSIRSGSQRPYNTWGSHRPIAGNRYSSTTAITWMPMNGIMPAKIWLSVTCGGETPFR